MARPRKPLNESLRWEIYVELCRWARTTNTIPNANVFWRKVLRQAGYCMAHGSFLRQWDRLIADGLVKIEPLTNSIIIVDLAIVEKTRPDVSEDARIWLED